MLRRCGEPRRYGSGVTEQSNDRQPGKLLLQKKKQREEEAEEEETVENGRRRRQRLRRGRRKDRQLQTAVGWSDGLRYAHAPPSSLVL